MLFFLRFIPLKELISRFSTFTRDQWISEDLAMFLWWKILDTYDISGWKIYEMLCSTRSVYQSRVLTISLQFPLEELKNWLKLLLWYGRTHFDLKVVKVIFWLFRLYEPRRFHHWNCAFLFYTKCGMLFILQFVVSKFEDNTRYLLSKCSLFLIT